MLPLAMYIANLLLAMYGLQCYSYSVLNPLLPAVVVDTNRWYHQTTVLPGNISITIGSEYN